MKKAILISLLTSFSILAEADAKLNFISKQIAGIKADAKDVICLGNANCGVKKQKRAKKAAWRLGKKVGLVVAVLGAGAAFYYRDKLATGLHRYYKGSKKTNGQNKKLVSERENQKDGLDKEGNSEFEQWKLLTKKDMANTSNLQKYLDQNLVYEVQHDREKQVKFLLKRGADPNTEVAYKRQPPLYLALHMGFKPEVAQLLIDYGARISDLPLSNDKYDNWSTEREKWDPLYMAVEKSYNFLIPQILDARNKNPNKDYESEYPESIVDSLKKAMESGNREAIKIIKKFVFHNFSSEEKNKIYENLEAKGFSKKELDKYVGDEDWKIERLLFIPKYKNENESNLSKLPKDILQAIQNKFH